MHLCLWCVVLSFFTFLFDLFLVLALHLFQPLKFSHPFKICTCVYVIAEEQLHQSMPIDQDQLSNVHCASDTLRSRLNTGHRYCRAPIVTRHLHASYWSAGCCSEAGAQKIIVVIITWLIIAMERVQCSAFNEHCSYRQICCNRILWWVAPWFLKSDGGFGNCLNFEYAFFTGVECIKAWAYERMMEGIFIVWMFIFYNPLISRIFVYFYVKKIIVFCVEFKWN